MNLPPVSGSGVRDPGPARPINSFYFRPTEEDQAIIKRKQINTLRSVMKEILGILSFSNDSFSFRIFNENVSEIQPDVQYSVEFDLSSGQRATLLVFLPPGFPRERPVIRLKQTELHHPWLDANGTVVGAPGLINYTVHSDLGRVVQAIKRELEKSLGNTGWIKFSFAQC